MKFYRKIIQKPQKLGVLAGSFNPPTIAHQELAYSAGFYVDQVLCVVPSALPHKEYFGATLDQRLDMLATANVSIFGAIASSEAALFLDIARECKACYGPDVQLYFVCGRDAAERVLTWDYGRHGVVEEMLKEFELLVAARQGEFEPPLHLRARVHRIFMRGDHDAVSSTEVRERIERGEPWEHLVPREIVDRVREIYSKKPYS